MTSHSSCCFQSKSLWQSISRGGALHNKTSFLQCLSMHFFFSALYPNSPISDTILSQHHFLSGGEIFSLGSLFNQLERKTNNPASRLLCRVFWWIEMCTQAKANNFKAGESLSTLDPHVLPLSKGGIRIYDAVSDVVESGVQSRSNFQIGSRVLKDC